MIFDNVRDSISRLNDTIVMYRGRAMLVHSITDDNEVRGRVILTGDGVIVAQTDPDYSSVCPSLGYINTESNALYFMRQPMRRWKQGVDARALVCPSGGIRARGAIDHSHIAKCLEGDYPSLEDALGMFGSINPFKENRRQAVAFSKHFAVHEGGDGHLLHYKGLEVGVVENGQPILSGQYFWLNELLESEQ